MQKNDEKTWRCSVCGFIHYGEAAPEDGCPICNAKVSDFEEIEVAVRPEVRNAGEDRIVIMGAGVAGVSAAETLREHAPDAEIILLSKEMELPYMRINLSRLLAGEFAEKNMPLHGAEWYEQNRIKLMPGVS